MTVDQREDETLHRYYEVIPGFEDIHDMQVAFSNDVARRIIELGPQDTTVVVPLIGGMQQLWCLADAAPELVPALRQNVVFMAKDSSGNVHFHGQPVRRHVVAIDDIGDMLDELKRLLASGEFTSSQNIETVHFFAPVGKIHTPELMVNLNRDRKGKGLPEVDFYIPHILPNDANGEPIWVCSGFGMNEGPDPRKLSGGNVSGSLTSLASYQRTADVCLRRREGVVPNYVMEIRHFASLQRPRSKHPDQTGRTHKLIDLETYIDDWQRQFRLIDLLGW